MQRNAASRGASAVVVAVALAFLPGSVAQTANEMLDPVDTITDSYESPCSCDCCQVMSGLPDEVIKTDSGKTINKKCGPTGLVSGLCPSKTCKGEKTETALFLSAVKEDVDYDRYCAMFCYPTYADVGSQCKKVDINDVRRIATPDGNGRVVLHTAPSAPKDGGEIKPAGVSSPQEVEAQAKQAADAAKLDMEVVWDMRKLLAERYRSESGAHVARGFAAMVHTQAAEYSTNRQAMLAKKAATAVAPFQGKIGSALNVAEGAAADAAETAATTRAVLLEAKAEAAKVAAETEQLAKAEIRRQAAPAAKREAAAQVILHAWDKPPSWPRVLAVRAADPYLHAMVGAIQRTSEYDGFAKGLLGQSKGAIGKAAALTSQANLDQAHGDRLNAERKRLKIRGLLARSKSLQSEATKFWNIAESTRKTIPEWQIAGTHAAAHTAWAFALAISTEPSFL